MASIQRSSAWGEFSFCCSNGVFLRLNPTHCKK